MVPRKTTSAALSSADIRHGDGLFVDIQTDVKGARVTHG